MTTATGKVWSDLLSVERGQNNTVLVRLRLTNKGEAAFFPSYTLSSPVNTTLAADGITLVDVARNKRYFPLAAADGKCLCSETTNITINPGQSQEAYAILPAPPPDVKNIGVSIPLTPVFGDVPIGNGPAQPPAGAPATPGKPPKILPLINTVEGDEKSVDEDDTNQNFRLSSDVLFALNKANITAKAKSLLADVAKRIDQSQGNTVKIDGYTDNSGNDAINEPLSRRRAEAVQNVLKGQVTKQGLTFQAAGHGSKDPIASNDTPQGRQKNRRTTVSFARPALAQSSAQPAPPSPAPAQSAGGKAIATAQPKDQDVQSIKLDITEFRRDSSGMATMVWTLTNNGQSDFISTTKFATPGTGVVYFRNAGGTMGVTLKDETSSSRYYSLRDTEDSCICADLVSSGNYQIKPSGSMTHYNSFKVPPELKSVTVEFPGYQPVQNVAISG